MSNTPNPEHAINFIQPVSDDFSTDGYLNEYARIDHQHPLSESLRAAIFNPGGGNSSNYLPLAGGTVTGQVNFATGGALALYLTGSGEQLRFANVNAYMTFYSGASRLGYFQGTAAGLIIASEVAGQRLTLNGVDGVTMSPFKINGYTASEGIIGNRIVLTNVNGYIFGNYFNCTAADNVGWPSRIAGCNNISSDTYIRWYNMQGNLSIGASNFISTRTTALSWGDSAFWANPGAARAGICLHPGGVAGNMRMDQSFASYMFVDTAGTAYYSCSASAFAVGSKRSYKQDIADWPPKPGPGLSSDEQVIKAMDIVRQLNIVSYKLKEKNFMAQTYKTDRRNQAFMRLNKFRENRGIEPYQLDIHYCDDPICDGTLESPCGWRKNWAQDSLGLIVEDTIAIAPEIVAFDKEGEPGFIDVHSHVSLLHAAIKELEERVFFLEKVS